MHDGDALVAIPLEASENPPSAPAVTLADTQQQFHADTPLYVLLATMLPATRAENVGTVVGVALYVMLSVPD